MSTQSSAGGGDFTSNLGRVYGIYTGGFAAFVVLVAILEQLGHQVVHAHNGRRALELARLADFDLLMLDGRMPHMDGPQTMAAVRALDGPISVVPIIAVIGGDADEARQCLDAGADTVLRKPVTVAGVARAVADAAARARPETAGARSAA